MSAICRKESQEGADLENKYLGEKKKNSREDHRREKKGLAGLDHSRCHASFIWVMRGFSAPRARGMVMTNHRPPDS